RRIIFLSYEAAEDLFKEPEKALGKAVKFKGELYEVIGVGEKVNMDNIQISFGPPESMDEEISVIPEKAIREVEQGEAEIQNISVILEPGEDTEEVINNVKDKLYELHPDV